MPVATTPPPPVVASETTRLRALAERLCLEAQQNPYLGFPDWLEQVDPATLYQRPLLVCGSLWYAKLFLQFARSHGLNVVGVVDDFRAGKTVEGFGLISSKDAIRIARNTPDCVALNLADPHYGLQHFDTLARDNGMRVLNYFQALRLPGFSPQVGGQADAYFNAIVANPTAYFNLADAMADDYSKQTFYAVLLYRLTQDRRYLLHVNRPYDSQYFYSGLFELGDNEVFVDAGAYKGDTAQNFIHAVQGRFRHIHSFEPDSQNFQVLEAYRNTHYGTPLYDQLSCYPAGLWDKSTQLYFNAAGHYGSHILFHHLQEGADSLGSRPADNPMTVLSSSPKDASAPLDPAHAQQALVAVDVVALDDTVEGPVTLLKMDIEGSEFPAIKGARRILQQHKPKLAIAVYHMPNDMTDIIGFVQSLDLGYRLGMRHHNFNLWDTVFYAY